MPFIQFLPWLFTPPISSPSFYSLDSPHTCTTPVHCPHTSSRNITDTTFSLHQTSPYHTYLTLHLPKLLLASLPLAAAACVPSRLYRPREKPNSQTTSSPNWYLDEVNVRAVRGLLLPPLVFVLLISGLAHKEWRFVVYVVPMVNVAAAVGAYRLISLPTGSLRILTRLGVTGLVLGNILVTIILTTISRANYPGGAALTLLNTRQARQPSAHVHIDNLAAQTGASLFTQEHASPFFAHLNSSTIHEWTYSKDPAPASFDSFTFLVTEHPEVYSTNKWEVIDSVEALEKIDPRRGWNALITKPTLFILQNKDLVRN